MLLEDEKVHNCNHTEYRLQPCITAYALFNIQYCVFLEHRGKKWVCPDFTQVLQISTVFYFSKHILKRKMSTP